MSPGLGISTQSVSGYSSCSVQLILRNSIILESEDGAFVNLYWARGNEATGAGWGSHDGGVVCGDIRDGEWDKMLGKPSFGEPGTRKQIVLLPLGAQSPLAQAL